MQRDVRRLAQFFPNSHSLTETAVAVESSTELPVLPATFFNHLTYCIIKILLPEAGLPLDMTPIALAIQLGWRSVESSCLPLHLLAAFRSRDGQALVVAVTKAHHVPADQVP